MSDTTSRLEAALAGRYDIERKLGEGGMASVYLADDLKHERKVAVKVLKPELAAVVGADRFLAEIKTTANLQHPHILPLFDSGEAGGFLFYVMPYVEGESLRDRLDRDKQLPVDEAIRIATDIAEALHAAHERGVIHRDIKPANILLSKGRPLVADFGIALAVGAAGGNRLTETGLSVGTPFYMSPEQATGDQSVGPASDIYALSAVLYEMLIGEPPFVGSSAQAVLGRIIQGEPVSPREIRKSIPAHVDAAIRKALEKLPADRFGNAEAFGRALSDEGFRYGAGSAVAGGATALGRNRWVAVGVAAATAVAGLVGGWALGRGGTASPARVITDELTLGPSAPGRDLLRATVSADGSSIVMWASDTRSIRSLFVREADEMAVRPLANTDGAWNFAPSPDGDEVAFTAVALGPLRVVSTDGAGQRVVAERAQGPPVWSDTHIYFTNSEFGISRVPRAGGEMEQVTPRTEEPVFRVPSAVISEHEALLFTETEAGGSRPRIHVLWLDSGETSFVTEGSSAIYVDGFLIYTSVAGNQIMAAPFDARRGELAGREVAVVSNVGGSVQFVAGAAFSVSRSGDLVYQEAGRSARARVTPVWVDRSGGVTAIDPDWALSPAVALTGLDLSHDGSRLVFASRNDESFLDVWVKDLRGGPTQRLSFDPPTNTRPFWSPDDEEIFYFRDPEGGFVQGHLLAIPSDGSGTPRLVLSDVGIGSGSWGVGHDWMIFRVGVPARESRDIYGLRAGEAEPVELVATPATEQAPSLSPDGRWLLYQSDRSGEHNVFVRPFPNVADGLVQISQAGGIEPQWGPSGEEIFYRDANGWMVSAKVEAGGALRVTARDPLFDASRYWSDPAAQQYDVAPDGERFLMLEREPGSSSLVVVWNWIESVKARFEETND
jgi:hypothetical protein